MRCLVVYYSLSGITRRLAEQAARQLGADIVEVRTPHYRASPFGAIRAAMDSWRDRLPPIDASGPSPEAYAYVLVLAPVWAGRAATPIRAYLARNSGKFKRAGFVLTCGNWCPARAFEQMQTLSGIAPEATLVLRAPDVKDPTGLPPTLATLVLALAQSQAA